ncbi:MAG: sensor histidine kinase, partial [Vampirovibrionia bacterium]
HDLRNPLTVISSISSILLSINNNNLDENQLLMIGQMKKSCETMVMLINDLLDITSIQSGKVNQEIKPHKVDELLDIDNFSSKLIAKQKGIEIVSDIEKNLPVLNVDGNRFQQIFENLLSNAVKFSHTNTTITLKAVKENNTVKISVIDQGQGIPKEDLHKLFKPYEKTSVKPTGKESSTGLGLAIVKKLVELYNATIDVESCPTKGSVFTVTFPITD